MNGRILSTTERIVAVVSPGSDDTLRTLREWTDDAGVDLRTIPVGDDLGDVERRGTLGVTLGGDGTFLEGIRNFAPREIPVLGVNTGTLAFLATIDPGDLEAALSEVLRGRAHVNHREQLHVNAPGVDATGINDAMIEHVPPENPVDRKITDLSVFVDGEFIGEYQGSGLAISTPTGSTGVSLSAGGPVHHPSDNDTLQIVPLQTHTIGIRPLVVSADKEVEIVPHGPASLLVDGGRWNAILEDDDAITVTGADTHALLVETSYNDDFFAAVSKKLGWDVREGESGRTAPSRGNDDREESTVQRALRVAREAARSAGPPVSELHGETESIQYKTDKSDIVTEADFLAERIITTAIESEFPDHGIFSEEGARKDAKGPYTWMIDPLDGTGNFAHGNPNYSISIALLEDGDPAMGVVYAPETDELFSAVRGGPALRNGEPISTTGRDSLDESMLLSGYDPDGEFLQHCYRETRGIRSLGSAALHLCYLAGGSVDGVWEYDTYAWDVAAGITIARAAGATVSNTAGDRYELNLDGEAHNELVGSNGELHPTLLEHLSSFAEGEVAGGD